MGNETTTLKRPNGGRRGGSTGRQVVGDYTCQRAGDAAQAVRRAGLRPGLERSFGCDPSLLGLVVSQEPHPGSALARNGMVTLHVAAPGNANATDDAAPAGAAPAEPTTASEPPLAPADVDRSGNDPESREAASGARRRRKPGLSGRAPQVFETAPAPRPPAEPEQGGETGEAWGEPVEPEPAVEVEGTELSEDGFDGLTEEEVVVHVDGLFAGRTGRWRPSRRRSRRARGLGRGVRDRLTAHPWLAAGTAFAIGLWVLLGTLGALAGGQHAEPRHPASSRLTARAPIAHADRAPRTRAGRPAPRHREITRRTVTRRAALPRRRAHAAARPASAARPVVAPATTSAPAAPVERTPAAVSVPVHVSEPPPPPPAERTSGGLFSP